MTADVSLVLADGVDIETNFSLMSMIEQMSQGISNIPAGNALVEIALTEAVRAAVGIKRRIAAGAAGNADYREDAIRLCALVNQLNEAVQGMQDAAGVAGNRVTSAMVYDNPGLPSSLAWMAKIEAENRLLRLENQQQRKSMDDLNHRSLDIHSRPVDEQIVRGPGNSWRARQLQKTVNMAVDRFVVTNPEARVYVRHLKTRIYALVKKEYPPERVERRGPGSYKDVPNSMIRAAVAFVKTISVRDLYEELAATVEVRVDAGNIGRLSDQANPLRRKRLAAGFSISQLARLAGVTRKAIINHESDQQDLLPEAQARVNMVLDGVRPKRGYIVYRPGRR